MKIPKKQWQKWASEFAERKAGDFRRNVPLRIDLSDILEVMIEAAVLYGMERAAVMDARGCDLSAARGLEPATPGTQPQDDAPPVGPTAADDAARSTEADCSGHIVEPDSPGIIPKSKNAGDPQN